MHLLFGFVKQRTSNLLFTILIRIFNDKCAPHGQLTSQFREIQNPNELWNENKDFKKKQVTTN